MRAAFYDTPGPARSVLRVLDVERPEPGPGQVRIRVALSAINPGDMFMRLNSTPQDFQRVGAHTGRIPHQDGTGTIDAVGAGVDPSRIGERVWIWMAGAGHPWGTAAEWTVVPSEQAVALPDGISDELGACLGIPAMTAHWCLHADGSPRDRTVLVAAGAGAVGHYAIELGRIAGARVVTTVSGPEKAALARAAGADLVVNYRDADAAQQILDGAGPVDRIIEVSLTDNLELDLAVTGPRATIVTYAAQPDDPTLPVFRLMWSNLVLRFALFLTEPREALLRAATEITAALREGDLTPLPVHSFSLDDVALAHEAVENGLIGKAVLDLRCSPGELMRGQRKAVMSVHAPAPTSQ